MIYAGIGSRSTPVEQCERIINLAKELDSKGFMLRSGGAKGADTAFAKGSTKREIFRPEHATLPSIQLASTIHPAWHNCSDYAQKLHGRNMMIVLGHSLEAPADFVICWSADENVGGTSMGLRLARMRGIKVFNLAKLKDDLSILNIVKKDNII